MKKLSLSQSDNCEPAASFLSTKQRGLSQNNHSIQNIALNFPKSYLYIVHKLCFATASAAFLVCHRIRNVYRQNNVWVIFVRDREIMEIQKWRAVCRFSGGRQIHKKKGMYIHWKEENILRRESFESKKKAGKSAYTKTKQGRLFLEEENPKRSFIFQPVSVA